ncbi:MAG: ABC transporter ATP-binding protein [Candidatus Saganbacteria bacterium]|nr:ABC transporter ATP-binding protein [Candidatus Saganbacteria bacterium]
MGENCVVCIKDVNKTYHLETLEVPVLFDIDFSVSKGEFVSIMGPSGCGKSTLMNLIGCLDRPSSGSIVLDGVDVSSLSDPGLAEVRNKKIGFVFQTFNLLPRMTSLENVELPLIYSGLPRAERKRKAEKALASVGMQHREGFLPNQISGGEKQRVAIARAIVNGPSIILADEPTGNLDSKSGADVMKIFEGLNGQGVTILMVTHDQNIAGYSGRLVRLFDGKILEDRKTK